MCSPFPLKHRKILSESTCVFPRIHIFVIVAHLGVKWCIWRHFEWIPYNLLVFHVNVKFCRHRMMWNVKIPTGRLCIYYTAYYIGFPVNTYPIHPIFFLLCCFTRLEKTKISIEDCALWYKVYEPELFFCTQKNVSFMQIIFYENRIFRHSVFVLYLLVRF